MYSISHNYMLERSTQTLEKAIDLFITCNSKQNYPMNNVCMYVLKLHLNEL